MGITAGTNEAASAATFGLARRTDPETSHAAAGRLRNLRASQREVLELFRRYGSMDDKDLVKMAAHAGVKQSPSGLRTRRSELVKRELLVDSGARIHGDGEKPRTCIIWQLAPGA